MTTIAPSGPGVRDPLPIRCINCRYDLSANEQDGCCPECGLPIAESTGPRRGWTVRRLGHALRMFRTVGVFAGTLVALEVMGLLNRARHRVGWCH